jgi:arabinan endo-1,5-alpha-L-arabinosidase
VIRDTIPANGFDNGIRVRLTDKDEFAIKDGGYAIFENVVTDSIKSKERVLLQVKNATSGKIVIRDGKKDGSALVTCDLSKGSVVGNGLSEVECSVDADIKGIKDFYLTASGVSGEVLVGNIIFKPLQIICNENCGESSSSITSSSSGVLVESSSSGRTAIHDARRAVVGNESQNAPRKGFHDLKGRRFDNQIPYRVMF